MATAVKPGKTEAMKAVTAGKNGNGAVLIDEVVDNSAAKAAEVARLKQEKADKAKADRDAAAKVRADAETKRKAEKAEADAKVKAERDAKKAEADKKKEEETARLKLEKEQKDADAAKKKELLGAEKAERDRIAAEKKAERDAFLARTTEEAYIPAPLTADQLERRTMLEEQARAHQTSASLEAARFAQYLGQIISEKLHHDYDSAGAYTQKVWGISRSAANRKIVFGNFVGKRLEIEGLVVEGQENAKEQYYLYPESESLVRPLNTLGTQTLMHQAWDMVVAECRAQSEATGKIVRPKATMVQVVVDELKGKGSTAVGLDAELEQKDVKAGKVPSGGKAWRKDFRRILFVDDKGRRYQAESIGEMWKASIFELEADGRPKAEALVEKMGATVESAYAFWDSEKATLDATEDAAFDGDSGTLPTAEVRNPVTGEWETPGTPGTSSAPVINGFQEDEE